MHDFLITFYINRSYLFINNLLILSRSHDSDWTILIYMSGETNNTYCFPNNLGIEKYKIINPLWSNGTQFRRWIGQKTDEHCSQYQ